MRAGFSVAALSEKLGVTRQRIRRWEEGDVLPDANQMEALAHAFNVPRSALTKSGR